MKEVRESYFEAKHDTSIDAIMVDWLTNVTSEEYKTGMYHIVNLLKANPTGTLLVNTVNLGVVSNEDHLWSQTEWLQQVLAAGLKTTVMITSSDILAQMALDDVVEGVKSASNNRVEVHYFDNKVDARSWLIKRAESVSSS
ncbi:MAG: hypothetical protein WBA23_20860 [Tunicatimonas sp.]|uniref:hypothetical protein n=1 Tax=Tunicatimonas sp. TaxID=1940096 RepID=UPI003C7082B5